MCLLIAETAKTLLQIVDWPKNCAQLEKSSPPTYTCENAQKPLIRNPWSEITENFHNLQILSENDLKFSSRDPNFAIPQAW